MSAHTADYVLYHRYAGRRIVPREFSSLAQGDPHGPKVVRRNAVLVNVVGLAGWTRQVSVPYEMPERQHHREADIRHARLMPEALDQLSEIFLRTGILRKLGNPKQEEHSEAEATHSPEKKPADSACQGGESDVLDATA